MPRRKTQIQVYRSYPKAHRSTNRLAQPVCASRVYTGGPAIIECNALLSGKTLQNKPVVCQITIAGVRGALQQGLRDFSRRPCHYGFVVLIYPVIGLALFTWASGVNVAQLLFPMVTGFALLGPFAIIGLYEMSRRLEKILIHLGHMFSTFLSLLLCPKLRCLLLCCLGYFCFESPPRNRCTGGSMPTCRQHRFLTSLKMQSAPGAV